MKVGPHDLCIVKIFGVLDAACNIDGIYSCERCKEWLIRDGRLLKCIRKPYA